MKEGSRRQPLSDAMWERLDQLLLALKVGGVHEPRNEKLAQAKKRWSSRASRRNTALPTPQLTHYDPC